MFKLNGKADRFEWWVTTCIAGLIAQGAAIFAVLSRLESSNTNWLTFVALVAVVLAAIWVMVAVTVKRFRDCGFSPWLTLGALVPGVGELFLLVVCGFFPSSGKQSKRKLVRRIVK